MHISFLWGSSLVEADLALWWTLGFGGQGIVYLRNVIGRTAWEVRKNGITFELY